MCGVTLSIPAKNTTSSATKEEQRQRRILDDNFSRRLLKRKIHSYKLDSYYIGTNIFTEKGDSNIITAMAIINSYVIPSRQSPVQS